MTNILLIDDEVNHCQLYVDYIRENSSPYNLFVATGCSDGLTKVISYEPEAIILDLEFHNSDGDGILFLETLKSMELKIRPFIFIITKNSSQRIQEKARENSDYIIPKYKPDYSPELVLNLVSSVIISKSKNKIMPKIKTIEQDICVMIERAGIIKNTDGKSFLIDAVAIVVKAKSKHVVLSQEVYPQIASKYGVSTESVEKGIKYAIQKAWNETDMEILAEYFSGASNVMMSAPQNKDVIFNFAERFKRENG